MTRRERCILLFFELEQIKTQMFHAKDEKMRLTRLLNEQTSTCCPVREMVRRQGYRESSSDFRGPSRIALMTQN